MNEIKHAIDSFKELKPILQSQLLKTNCEGLGIEDAKELGQHFDIAIKCMEHQLANRWIPCSERSPEENGNYIVTVEDCLNRRIITEVSAWLKSYERFESEDRSQSVIAWQPLPEKYKEKLNEE